MAYIMDRAALVEAACNGSLSGGTMVAAVRLAWGGQSREFITQVTQEQPGDDVIALDIMGQQVPLFSQDFNNLTIHTFKGMAVKGGAR